MANDGYNNGQGGGYNPGFCREHAERRELEVSQWATMNARLDRLESVQTEMRNDFSESKKMLQDIKVGLEVLRVKSGLIGTIAAMITAVAFILYEWLKGKMK